MKLRLPQRKLFRISLYLFSITLILLAIDLLWVRIDRHITVAPDITHITSPLKPDGLPDYVKFIDDHFSAGITPDNNAAVILQQVFGPTNLRDYALQPIYARLGLTPPSTQSAAASTQYFISYDDYVKAATPHNATATQKLDLAQADTHPWTAAENPLLAACIERNANAFNSLHQAVERPRYFFPMINSPGHDEAVSLLILQLGPCLQLGRLTAAHAMLLASTGNPDDLDNAHAALLDVHKLARLIAQQPTLIEYAGALTLEQLACRADQRLALSEKLSAQQARQFLADLDSLPSFAPIADRIDNGERLFELDCCIFAAKIGLPDASRYLLDRYLLDSLGSPVLARLSLYLVPANFNDAMRITNSYYDRFMGATEAPTFAQRTSAMHRVEADAQTLHNTTWNPAKEFLSYLIPSLTNILINRDTAAMQFDLARLSLALAACHADHHTYPDSLSALAPDYLPTIPEDFFVNKPLHYTISKSPTGYLLYSVGPNMQDDAGHSDDLIISSPQMTTPTILFGSKVATRLLKAELLAWDWLMRGDGIGVGCEGGRLTIRAQHQGPRRGR